MEAGLTASAVASVAFGIEPSVAAVCRVVRIRPESASAALSGKGAAPVFHLPHRFSRVPCDECGVLVVVPAVALSPTDLLPVGLFETLPARDPNAAVLLTETDAIFAERDLAHRRGTLDRHDSTFGIVGRLKDADTDRQAVRRKLPTVAGDPRHSGQASERASDCHALPRPASFRTARAEGVSTCPYTEATIDAELSRL